MWGLFDTKKVNAVYSDDFVAAMALLSRCGATDASFEEQIKACFIMFDTRANSTFLTLQPQWASERARASGVPMLALVPARACQSLPLSSG